ncbi:CYFA0S03e02696g1_1 [Cyberlindnera fabianii]|uniref:CTD kinase subunit beta n=1 Tax=Cyberlindnera fabianii TaxID=36022 RepID=A0A061AP99_CYBFA|nr:CTD kinase subunit beta [Cyberlindnera fabianii]CDR39383.1 CYFA0S03e02696g1_1 [Cyberlindnera fabianii]
MESSRAISAKPTTEIAPSEPKTPSSEAARSSTPGTNSTTATSSVTSTIQISRQLLTQNQMRYCQSQTIENRQAYDQKRSQMFNFLMKICHALRFPVRTLESAMVLYQRFYLHNKFDGQNYYDVALTSLFLATKNEDTVKKLRDIILTATQLRGAPLSNDQVEAYRRKLMNVEFKMLEIISFDFRVAHVEEYIVKIGKKLKIPQEICYLAWLIAYDSYQLEVALKVPANAIAFAVLQIACLINKQNIRVMYKEYHCSHFAVNEAMIDILDFFMNSYNFTLLSSMRPELKNEFFNIKVGMTDKRVMSESSRALIEKDEYFRERNFAVNERRYMLSNQRKRLYSELDKK